MKPIVRLIQVSLAMTLAWQTQLYAQEDARLSNREIIDAAIQQARNNTLKARNANNALKAPNQQGDAMFRPNLSSLAEQYNNSIAAAKLFDEPKVMVFVSTSMPSAALESIGRDLSKINGVMVLRGIRGSLGIKNAMQETLRYLERTAKTGVSIQIDPRLFAKFGINQVPALVIVNSTASCQDSACIGDSDIVYGDVTIEYALDMLARGGSPVASEAQRNLIKLRRAN